MSWFESLNTYSQVAPAISSIIVILSFLSAVVGVSVAWRNMKNSQISHLYSRVMDHNKLIFDNQYRQIAVNIFHDLENDQLKEKRESIENEKDGYYHLYWATRTIHLNHIVLFGQMWMLCGENLEKVRKHYPGWITFFENVIKDLDESHGGTSTKPDWYKEACRGFNLTSNEAMFSVKFVSMCRELTLASQKRRNVQKYMGSVRG